MKHSLFSKTSTFSKSEIKIKMNVINRVTVRGKLSTNELITL